MVTVMSAVQAKVQAASDSNPGVPPSSLFAWLKAKPSVAGVVLSDFDSAFRNPFYQSRFDDNNTTDVSSIAAAAAVVASTLHALAATPGTAPWQVTTAVDTLLLNCNTIQPQ